MAYFQIHNHLEFEPIFFEKNEDLLKDGVCVICLEETNTKLSMCSFLNLENVSLKKICSCDCLVHQKCLNPWLYKNQSCPICRKKMSSSVILQNTPQTAIQIVVIIFQNINVSDNVRQAKLFCQQMIRLVLLSIYFALILRTILDVTYVVIAYINIIL
jgi:hypothetical protein